MPPNVFDQASRYAARLDPIELTAWLLHVTVDRFAYRGWLDTRAIPFPGEPDRTGDTVAQLDDPADHLRPWAVPIEFQLEPDPLMFGRLLIYLGEIWLRVKPDPERGSRFHVGAVVVNLTGEGLASREMRWAETGLLTHLGVVERNLSREDADELLKAIEAGRRSRSLLPWIPLMTGAGETSIMERWKRIAETEPDERRRSDYGGLALVFAEAADRRAVWAESLKGWNMRQSQQVLEWQKEARIEGRTEGRVDERRTMLLETLADKFGPVAPELIQVIQNATDLDALRRWTAAAGKASSLDEFRQSCGI